MNLLPDSRSKKGAIRGPDGRYWVPVYCANCKSGAHTLVPEEGMTFAFWLCQKCEKGWGGLAAIYAVPDEVFFQNLKEAQIERYGRELEPEELISVQTELSQYRKVNGRANVCSIPFRTAILAVEFGRTPPGSVGSQRRGGLGKSRSS